MVIFDKLKKNTAILVFAIIVFPSCKNSLNIQAPYKDITVVYGLIDQNDPIHYIRINKAFEGAGNAYTMAQQYDSIYYPVGTIRAFLQDSDPVADVVVKIDSLDTTTAVPLPAGTFPTKQLLYYTKAKLNPNDYYNLIVTNAKTGKKIHGSTPLLQDIVLADPPNMSSRNYPFQLPSIPIYSPNIEWYSTSSAVVYQMEIDFYYDSKVGTGPAILQPPLQMVLSQLTAPSTLGGYQMGYSVSCQDLFALIISYLKPEAGVTRHADSLGIIFTTGTDDLNTYVLLSQPPTGINEDVPSYSDVVNGIGLYTARHVQTYYKSIDASTLDSIQGPYQEPRFLTLGFPKQ